MIREVGNYKLLEKLGEGGMGTVYLALDTSLEREVALKSLRPELAGQPDIVARFREEAKLLGRLESIHIVRLYQFLREGDEYFMVMEFVRGSTLASMLSERTRLTPEQAINVTIQVLNGLGYAHRRHIVHRDVKPANIMVSEEGVVKVTDFGIARLLGSARKTTAGNIVGTLEYISPEAVQQLEVTALSDLYSCGVVLYEMLTGELPFNSDNGFELASAHVKTPPPPLRQWVSNISQPLEDAVMRALAKDPRDRFQSAEGMAAALSACIEAAEGTGTRQAAGVFGRLSTMTGLSRAAGVGGETVGILPPQQSTDLQQAVTAGRGSEHFEAGETQKISPAQEAADGRRLHIAYVLFVDIVGYSLLTADGQTRAINRLQSMVRELPGFEQALATDELVCLPTGDGMAIACFREPTAPVQFARRLAIGLKMESSFAVRMGLHSGVVYDWTDINGRKNLAGGGMNIAQRIMDCGDGGHILASQFVADTLQQLTQWRDAVHDLGECNVKHDKPVRIFNLYTSEFGNPAMPLKIQQWKEGKPAPGASPLPAQVPAARPKSRLRILAAAAAAAAIVIAGLVFLNLPGKTPANTEAPRARGSATTKSAPLSPEIETETGNMMLVPAGPFLFGKDKARIDLSAFYIDETEVSNEAYGRFCRATGHPAPKSFDRAHPNFPVVGITVDDARAFALWAGKRLPDARQWEKAARGTDGRKYPWGTETTSPPANLSGKGPMPVDAFPAGQSPFGVLNMAGNVWEIVDEPVHPSARAIEYFSAALKRPVSDSEEWVTIRGGSYSTKLEDAVSDDWASIPAAYSAPDIGFRCTKDAGR